MALAILAAGLMPVAVFAEIGTSYGVIGGGNTNASEGQVIGGGRAQGGAATAPATGGVRQQPSVPQPQGPAQPQKPDFTEAKKKLIDDLEGNPEKPKLGKVMVFLNIDKFSGYIAAQIKTIWSFADLQKDVYLPEEDFPRIMDLAQKGLDQMGEDAELSWDSNGSVFRKYNVRKIPTIVYIDGSGKEQIFYDFQTILAVLRANQSALNR